MIKLEQVSLSYASFNEHTEVLKDITLHIKAGEWVSLIGSSGTGKTSLLKIIGGMQSPTKGTVQIGEQEIYRLDDTKKHEVIRSHLSFMYQQFRLLPQFNVLENIMLPLIPYENKRSLQKRAEEIIGKVGLAHRLNHFPQQLSGGEQQRAAFARALLTKPAILLCDEPTGNLDTKNRDMLLQLLKEVHLEGQTIILVTHDEVVASYGERILQIENGMLKEEKVPL
ncbi:ABC transporter ATP-binding protein [Solibacillus silvestris]|uniref:ABC transporter ATP-binding protein n=1 Tax=Solibacillus silvestris TaxID=76853 RepID=UPI003F81A427